MSHVKSKISFLFILLFFTGTVFAQFKPEITLNKKPAVEYSKVSKRTPDYKYFIMLGAGISIPAGNMEKLDGGFTANVSFSPYSNGSQGLRFDVNFLSMKLKDIYRKEYFGSENTHIITADRLTIYNIKIELLFGNLKPKSNFNLYGFSGIGVESRSGGEMHEKWIPANNYYTTESVPVYKNFEGLYFRFNFGTGMNFKITNSFRLFAEVQYEMSVMEILHFDPQTSNFMLRSGIFINF